MGFAEIWIDRVSRLISTIYYSVNINGSQHGFFKSSRGIRQGNPISPSLFIIGAELLSRLMDSLLVEGFIPYSCEKKGPILTHLCYADDTILFSFGDLISLKMMMSKLEDYQRAFGQLVNKQKSALFVSSKINDNRIVDIRSIVGFSHSQFPMQDDKEGGVGFRALQDIYNSFAAKMWWNFRTKNSLLTEFLEAKYCERKHPVARKASYNHSHSWRRLIGIKNEAENYILWRICKGEGDQNNSTFRSGQLHFEYSNTTRQGRLPDLDTEPQRRIHLQVSMGQDEEAEEQGTYL
ncbi:PREDICTED: uncharacterized protein LOC109219861 [Nicotiana attenuata]|uniref:uncharacterized protein LOC109219861 n=1 Tax=Nicotiana attenuata TaxID=49451 RepID=UPI000904F6B6|nr:PREDICTED: uncharacterized protein LOC109219861 [Nicotiana attenuata]